MGTTSPSPNPQDREPPLRRDPASTEAGPEGVLELRSPEPSTAPSVGLTAELAGGVPGLPGVDQAAIARGLPGLPALHGRDRRGHPPERGGARLFPERVPRVLRVLASRGTGLHDRRPGARPHEGIPRVETAPARGEHPAVEPSVDSAGSSAGVPERGVVAAVLEDPRAVAGPRALGDPGRGVAVRTEV